MSNNVAIYFDKPVRVCIDEETAKDFWLSFLGKLPRDNKIYCCAKWFELKQIIDKKDAVQLVITNGDIQGKLKRCCIPTNGELTIPLKFDKLAHLLYEWSEFFEFRNTEEESDKFDKQLYKLDLESFPHELYHEVMYEYIEKEVIDYYA